MRWWLTVGLILQSVGLVLAIIGIASTKRDLFPGHPLPHRRALSWLKRTVTGQRGQSVVLATASVQLGDVVMSAFGHTLPARPGPDASAGEWGAYLERKVDNLAALRDRDLKAWTERTNALDSSIDDERRERVDDIARVEQRAVTAVGGEEGKGLDLAWWGLTLTVVGTVVAGVAGIISA